MSWRSHLYAAVRHPTRSAVLLLRGDPSWGLPRTVVPLELWTGDADKAVPALVARLGTKLWQYRQIHATADDELRRIEIVFEMDLVDDNWSPPANARWVGLGELDRLLLRNSHFRPILDRYLNSLANESAPPQRMPWCRRGWLAEVKSWIESAIGEHRITNVTQVKQWSASNVLRVETEGPAFYFKVSPPLRLFVNEAAVSGELARMFPGFVPRPLAIRPETGWMLLADLGEIADDPPLAIKLDAYRRVADLHIRSIARVDELLAAGCHDRRLDVLATQIDPLLADKQVMSNMAAGERRRLLRLAPRLRQYCGALTTYGIPPTLVHGDFHLGNVGPGVDGPILFDWSDACIAHPFIDLHGLDWETTADRNRLLTAYLWRWEGYESSDGLERVLALARILIPLLKPRRRSAAPARPKQRRRSRRTLLIPDRSTWEAFRTSSGNRFGHHLGTAIGYDGPGRHPCGRRPGNRRRRPPGEKRREER